MTCGPTGHPELPSTDHGRRSRTARGLALVGLTTVASSTAPVVVALRGGRDVTPLAHIAAVVVREASLQLAATTVAGVTDVEPTGRSSSTSMDGLAHSRRLRGRRARQRRHRRDGRGRRQRRRREPHRDVAYGSKVVENVKILGAEHDAPRISLAVSGVVVTGVYSDTNSAPVDLTDPVNPSVMPTDDWARYMVRCCAAPPGRSPAASRTRAATGSWTGAPRSVSSAAWTTRRASCRCRRRTPGPPARRCPCSRRVRRSLGCERRWHD